jgi:ABC-type sugar transport system permease subunit
MTPRRFMLRPVLTYVGAFLILLWSGGPFVWQFSTSFQLDRALTAPTPSFIPHPFTWQHYANAFFQRHLWFYLRNSLIVASLTTLLCLVAPEGPRPFRPAHADPVGVHVSADRDRRAALSHRLRPEPSGHL